MLRRWQYAALAGLAGIGAGWAPNHSTVGSLTAAAIVFAYMAGAVGGHTPAKCKADFAEVARLTHEELAEHMNTVRANGRLRRRVHNLRVHVKALERAHVLLLQRHQLMVLAQLAREKAAREAGG